MKRKSKWTSPTMVIACLALFISLTGSSIAAGHYLITSTKQIKPSVLTKLKGAKGPKGSQGARGSSGISGLVAVTSAPVDLLYDYYIMPTATCPAGTSVVGTGSYGSIESFGWVKSYGTFAAGYLWNVSGLTVTGVHIQAICAVVSTSSSLSLSKQEQLQQFKADRATAMAQAARLHLGKQ